MVRLLPQNVQLGAAGSPAQSDSRRHRDDKQLAALKANDTHAS